MKEPGESFYDQESVSLESAQAHMYRRLHAVSRFPEAQSVRRNLVEAEARGLTPAYLRSLERQIDEVEDAIERQRHAPEIVVWHGVCDRGPGYVHFEQSGTRHWKTSEIGWGYTVSAYDANWLATSIELQHEVSKTIVDDPTFPEKTTVSTGTVFNIPATIETHWRAHVHGECDWWEFEFVSTEDEDRFRTALSEVQLSLGDTGLINEIRERFEAHHWDIYIFFLLEEINPAWRLPEREEVFSTDVTQMEADAYAAAWSNVGAEIESMRWTRENFTRLFDRQTFIDDVHRRVAESIVPE